MGKILISGLMTIAMVLGLFSLNTAKGQGNEVIPVKEPAYERYYDGEEIESMTVSKTESKESSQSSSKNLIDVDTNPDSITVLVNREYPLADNYVPADLVIPNVARSYMGIYEKSYMRAAAAKALEKLFNGAAKAGYSLKAVSAYRSYERQEQIYNRNVQSKGKKGANKISAKPGTSEHQTGLTIDVSTSSIYCGLEQSFGDTAEGKWLARNCYKYGFVIRYPKGKEDITGYSYEPWHIRYVGKNLAKYLYKKKMVLEEYYQTTTVDNKIDVEDQVLDTDENAPKEAQITSAPTQNPTYNRDREETEEKQVKNKSDKKENKVREDKESVVTTEKPKKTKKNTNKSNKLTKTAKPERTKKPVESKEEVKTQEEEVVTEAPAEKESTEKEAEATPEM